MKNKISIYADKLVKEGITITEIIKKSNVGRTSFYDIMNGKQVPKLDTANKIAKALSADIKELFPELKE